MSKPSASLKPSLKPGRDGRGPARRPSPTLLPPMNRVENSVQRPWKKMSAPFPPGLVKFTADPLFLDLWQRPALTPRDRSLGVTVSALIAAGQSAQIGYHLNRAMDNGLSAEEGRRSGSPRRRSTRMAKCVYRRPRWSVEVLRSAQRAKLNKKE